MSPPFILIVDDNPLNLKLACDVLAFDGYRIARAADAAEAAALIARTPPDLILMDIQMPGMDGLTFSRVLKSDAATRRIVVVALTSFAMSGDEDKARLAGCDAYLTKPIDSRRLGRQVAEAWERAQSQPELNSTSAQP